MLLMTTKQAAQELSLSRKTLEKMRLTGRGPNFRKLGGCVRYSQEDLAAWVESCLRKSTSDQGKAA